MRFHIRFSFLFLLILPELVLGQIRNSGEEENFVFQVKQMDEFIDRFNNANYTPIKKYLKEKYKIEDVNRSDLIKGLFNQQDQDWKTEEIVEFLADVTENKPPPYLDFYDKGWYAELDCAGLYKNKKENFTLVLSIEIIEATGGAKWVIEGVSADFLKIPPIKDYRKGLNPASYGTDFMGLIDALADTANYQNYISSDQQPSQLLLFFDELYEKKLVFKQVNRITYHFLQIDGWAFQVKDFNRNTKNSGWLISSLSQVNEAEKKIYREKILFLK